jgi:hypothetical protein
MGQLTVRWAERRFKDVRPPRGDQTKEGTAGRNEHGCVSVFWFRPGYGGNGARNGPNGIMHTTVRHIKYSTEVT